MPRSAPRPILFDTDIGSDVDDALALGFVLAEPAAFSLVAVTTVSGDTWARGQIAGGLLRLAGRQDVEVCAGEASPLLRPRAVFANFGHEGAMIPSGPESVVSDEPAAERIVRAAREVPNLEIVMIGPLTNLARALALDPQLPKRVAGLSVMGGHIRSARIGDFVAPYGIDYNLCSDPEATVAVLGAGFTTRLVTADVTLATWLSRDALNPLRQGSPLAREIARQVEIWDPVQRKLFTGIGGQVAPDNVSFLHDPLTLLALVDASSLGFEPLRIVPTIEGGVLRTREADPASGMGSPMEVATSVDAAAASAAITERLLRL